MKEMELLQQNNDWTESEWFKEWLSMSRRPYHGQKCGQWLYDNVTETYIFIDGKNQQEKYEQKKHQNIIHL